MTRLLILETKSVQGDEMNLKDIESRLKQYKEWATAKVDPELSSLAASNIVKLNTVMQTV